MTPETEAELFRKVDLLLTLAQQQGERLARIEGILANSPQAAEFYRLEGRVEELSRRLPTTLAYVPPPPKTTRAVPNISRQPCFLTSATRPPVRLTNWSGVRRKTALGVPAAAQMVWNVSRSSSISTSGGSAWPMGGTPPMA